MAKPYRLLACLLGLQISLAAGEAEAPSVQLPATAELVRLIEMASEMNELHLQYDPQRINGSVRLGRRAPVGAAELWQITNQALIAQNLTTVCIGNQPPTYLIVPIAEAAGQSAVFTEEALAGLPRQPGYAVVIKPLQHLSAETAVKTLATVFSNQVTQIRVLGQEQKRIVLAAPLGPLRQAEGVLALIDRPGSEPAVRLYRPQRTGAQQLQAAATAAWTAASRVSGRTAIAELQVAPDGEQLLLVSSAEIIDDLQATVETVDSAQPVEVRNYRPSHFGLDEVAQLLTQLLRDRRSGAQQPEIVRDRLTSSLVVTATVAQHQRIVEVLKGLEAVPNSERRQLRSIAVRHRPVEEVARMLSIVMGGKTGGDATAPASAPALPTPAPVAGTNQAPPALGSGTGDGLTTTASPGPGSAGVSVGNGMSCTVTTDPPTNRLILLGEPQQIEQIQALVNELDASQPQVEIEVILVTLSNTQTRELGVDLVGRINRGETSSTIGTLFGLSTASGSDATNRALPAAASGFNALVVKPGDFAGLVRAIETVTAGRNLIRAQVVVANNAKAAINGVEQQPLTSINSNSTVATTAVSGTTDAGTQVTVTPQVTAADFVTITYAVSLSQFLGSSTTTSNGTVIPPSKRADTVASVAIIPDGHVIAIGGLSSLGHNTGESRVPLIGSIPVIGSLFKSETKSETDSRFYVFIRANVLRHASFSDLRRMSDRRAGEARLPADWPTVEPQLVP